MNERRDFLRYCTEILTAFAMLVCVVVIILIVSRDGDSYGAAQIIKMDRLADAPHPRAVFIGGSGLAFGLDSNMIERDTHLNPVNLGLYAGYRIDYLLAQAETGLTRGDIAVIVPEYDLLTAPPHATGFLVLEAAQARPDAISFALSNIHSDIALVREFPTWLSTRVVSAIGRHGIEPFFGRSDTLYHRVYRKSGFNEYGDNIAAARESYRLPASEFSTSSAVVLTSPLNQETLEHIRTFIETQNARGVQVYIAWPAISRSLAESAAKNLSASETQLRDMFGSHILGRQSDFIFSNDSFFDTVNHLTPAAKEKRTAAIVKLLNERR